MAASPIVVAESPIAVAESPIVVAESHIVVADSPPHWELEKDHIGKFSHHIGRSRRRTGYHIGKFSFALADPGTTMVTTLGNSAIWRSRQCNGYHIGKFSHHTG